MDIKEFVQLDGLAPCPSFVNLHIQIWIAINIPYMQIALSAYSAALVDAPKVSQIKTQAKAQTKSPITFSSIPHPITSKLGYQCARIIEHKVVAECLCLMAHLDVGSSNGIWSDPATVVCASWNRWCASSCQLQGQNHSRAHTAELTISHHAAKLALILSSVQTDYHSTLAGSVRTEIGNWNKNK